MPQQSESVERLEIQLPADVAAALRETVGPRERNTFVVGLLARRLKVPYSPPKRGRPKKSATPE